MNSNKVNLKLSKILPHAEGFEKSQVLQLLEENEFDVEQTISDFEEGRAAELLGKWESAGGKSTKRKNKNNKNKDINHGERKEAAMQSVNGNIDENENQPKPVKKRRKPVKNPQNPVQSQQKPDSNGAITNGEILNDTHTASVVLKHMLTNQTSSEPAANARPDLIDLPHKKEKIVQNAINDKDVELEDKERDKKPTVQSSELSRNRMISESSTKTKANQRNRKGQRNASVITDKPKSGDTNQMQMTAMHNRKTIEKAARDLQRCSASFHRYRTLLNEEFDDSYKKLKQAFEEIQSEAMDREVSLMRTLDNRKESALALLAKREARASQLKKMTGRVDTMNPQELNDLRNDMKHFVSERKFEEELGKSIRFNSDKSTVINAIRNFGELSAVKNLSVGHHRERYESTASDVSSIPPLAEQPPQPTPSPEHHISPLAKTLPNQGFSASKDVPAPQKNSSTSRKFSSAPRKENAAPQRNTPPQRNTSTPQRNTPPQKNAPAPQESSPAPEQVVSAPQRSTSWADSEETYPLTENRAPWAVDTPLVSADNFNADEEKSDKPQPARSRNKPYYRRKNEKTNDSNPPEKNSSAPLTKHKDLNRDVEKFPGKAAGDANFQMKRGESRAGDGARRPREYDNRVKNYSPRGRGGFRGAPRGGNYYSRGGYRNDRTRFQNMNPRSGENNYYSRNNLGRNEQEFNQVPSDSPKSQSTVTPPTPDCNPAPKSSQTDKDVNSTFNPKPNQSNPLPPRNNPRSRGPRRFQAKNESNDEGIAPKDSLKTAISQPKKAIEAGDNKGLDKQE